jgi:hypothetical protein
VDGTSDIPDRQDGMRIEVGDADDDESIWRGADHHITDQPETCVYSNQHGQIVIRQRANAFENNDPFLYFNPESLPRLISALQAMLPRR